MLACVIASPAGARTYLIDFADHPSLAAGVVGAKFTTRCVEGELTRLGEDFINVPYNATKILWVRNAYHVIGWDPATSKGTAIDQCDQILLVNYMTQIDAGFDSLFRGLPNATKGSWANKPMGVIGPNYYPFSKWTQADGCSTGVTTTGVAAVARTPMSYAYYNAQGNQVWRTGSPQILYAPVASRPPGTWKTLIAYGIAYNYITTGGVQLCSDCDAVVRATSAAAESVAVWERGRSTGDPAPIVMADLGNPLRPELIGIVLARLHAATGGRIVKRTRKVSIAASGYMQTGSSGPSTNPVSCGAGAYIPASGLTDSLNQGGSADSVARKQIKMVLATSVNADTLIASYMGPQLRLLRRFGPTVRLTPQDFAGVMYNQTSSWFGIPTRGAAGSNAQTGNITGGQRVNDVWGVNRTRTWIKPGVGQTCAQGDSASPCLIEATIKRADSLARALGLAGVDRVMWPPSMDWTPSDVTRENATKLDSVLAAAARAGVRGFYCSPYTLDSSPDLYLSPFTSPLGWGHTERVFRAVDPVTRQPLGRIALLATRGFEALATQSPVNTHDLLGEFLLGWMTGGPWIWGAEGNIGVYPGLHLYHDLYAQFSVLTVSANSFGGTGDGTNPRRHGWWAVKGLAEIVSTTSFYAGSYLKPYEIVYPEQLATEAP